MGATAIARQSRRFGPPVSRSWVSRAENYTRHRRSCVHSWSESPARRRSPEQRPKESVCDAREGMLSAMVNRSRAEEVRAYYASLPPPARRRLREIRGIILSLAPGAEETL